MVGDLLLATAILPDGTLPHSISWIPAMLKRLVATIVFAASLVGACQNPNTNPWFGTWSLRAEDADGKPETLVYSDAGDGAMRMESVENKSVIVTRFDGAPASDSRAEGGRGALAVTSISPTSYSWTFWSDGKPFVEGLNTLATDRGSFTEVSWRVGKPDDKITLVYERKPATRRQ
jgi:hypothetical protein